MSNRIPRRAPALWVLAVAAPLLGGCGQKMALKVNNDVVTQEQFAGRCANYVGQNQLIGTPVGVMLLNDMINEQLMRQEVKRLKLEVTDADLNAQIASLRKRAQGANQSLEQTLKQAGLPFDAFKEGVRYQLLQQKLLTQGLTISDKEIEDFYNQNKQNQFTTPEQVEARQITVANEAAAKEVKQTLDKNAAFDLVAHSKSIDTFKDAGGKIPTLTRGFPNPSVSPDVISRAFTAPVGKPTDPIKVGNQWVVLKVESRKPASTKTLAEVKDDLRQGLLIQKAQQGGQVMKFQQRMMELRRDADVQVGVDQFKDPIMERQKQLKTQPTPGLQPGAGPGGMPGQ